MKIESKFGRFLNERGRKRTCGRIALFAGVRDQKGHFTIPDLVIRLKQKGCNVSRDTVYRSIDLLLESGVMRPCFLKAGEAYYEAVRAKHHDHLICRVCGRVIEFSNEQIEEGEKGVASVMGFKVDYHRHELVGVCCACQLTERKRNVKAGRSSRL